MTHNKYFFSGRLEGVRQTPEGGNLPQDFAPEEVEGGPHEKDVLPLATTSDPFGAASYNINPMLLEAIRMSDLFWNLPQFRTFSEVVDQIYYAVKYATPWVPGTHGKKSTGMQSAVRGVSNAGQETAFVQSLPKCRTPTFAICPRFDSKKTLPLLRHAWRCLHDAPQALRAEADA